MNTAVVLDADQELTVLCSTVRNLISNYEYNQCHTVVCKAMEAYPDAPQPHNLLGILYERQGNHAFAMRHFRAAYALDPSYTPARDNLDTFGTFFSRGACIYGDEDAQPVSPVRNAHLVNMNGRN